MNSKFFRPKKVLNERSTSPARVYTDGFLYENLQKLISKKEISVLDIGCGSGYVREIFHKLGFKVNYIGIDVYKHKHFDDYNKFAVGSEFIVSEIEKFNIDKKFDFIITMFALEHIENDKLAIQKINQMLQENGVQFHMVPSKFSFLVYFQHGYRRYNPKIIKEMFVSPSIWRICGVFSFLVHFILITFMKRFLRVTIIYRSSYYPKILKIANALDVILPIFPIAYIIVDYKNNETIKL